MNNIDDFLNELLLPLTDKKQRPAQRQIVKNEVPIYENGCDYTQLSLQTISAQPQQGAIFNFVALLGQLPSIPSLSEEAKTLLANLSDRLNVCKRHLTESNTGQPIASIVFENTLAYLYYISVLLPVFANNRQPFVYQLSGNKEMPVVQHTSFVFEYLITLWGLVAHMYRHLNLSEAASDPVKYTKCVNSIDFCIHVLREMVAYIGQIEKGTLDYHRFVYRASPTSISNTSASADITTNEELESIQREKDVSLVTSYFGGSRGINARLHLFYAKKYELSLVRALHITQITDILGNEDARIPFVTKENASHVVALAGVSLQISQHYGTVVKKIKDEECSTHHYAFYKSTYWQCVAHFLKASVDYYQYLQREDRIEYSKQALKRVETIRTTLESFNYVYRDRPVIIKAMSQLTSRMNAFFDVVNQKVRIMNHRSSDGVTLVAIEETMGDESNKSSVFQEQMKLHHQRLCENDEAVKQCLALLYKLKKHYNGGSRVSPLDTNDGNRVIVSPSSLVPSINPDDKITMAVIYERYNWAHYLVEHITTDLNGDALIIIRDVDLALKTLGDVKEKIKENLLNDPENETASTLSNKLSSHLYI